jgi:CRISPR-associated exonuclease Cas4
MFTEDQLLPLSALQHWLFCPRQCALIHLEQVWAENKRGKPKSHWADEVQLCAQAMCLEEMLGVAISSGCLFYGEKKRRTAVDFDISLRQLAVETSVALHAMIDSRATPLAEYDSRR